MDQKKFHTTHVTYEFHGVHPKLFMSIWYVQSKPCTYLVSRLAQCLNAPNRAPPDPRHLGVPSGASKTIYEPMVHLRQTEHLSCIDADSRHLGVPSGASNTISKPTIRSTQTVHQSCVNCCTISKQIKASFRLSLIT
jgi:hypothetical protein